MKTLVALVALVVGALGLPRAGQAIEFNALQPEKSSVGFAYKQMNVGMQGRFGKLTGQIRFDPDRAVSATVSLDVDLASIDTGTSEGDSAVAGKQWFDTRAYPIARFASNRVTPLAGNRYEVAGELSIKGRARPVTVPITVAVAGDSATFDGAFVLKRADFSIGEGQWADFGVVANEVRITFHVVATSGK
jgi:polyisoprenoid-binding protein YceI